MKIIRTNSRNPDFQQLTKLLDQYYWVHYGEVQAQFDDYNKKVVAQLDTVLLLYIGQKAVASACFIELEPFTAEVKRVFVLPEYRRQGLAIQLMQAIEIWALELGYQRLVLETGYKEDAAIRLYQKLGYLRIDNYVFYREVPESRCFGKDL